MLRRGQSLVESAIAVTIVTFVFFGLYELSQALTGRILVQHAAMRVARARAVGFNEFMCLKTARLAVIPVAGQRPQPTAGDGRDDFSETAAARIYLQTPNEGYAHRLLDYERWDHLAIDTGADSGAKVTLKNDWFKFRGEAVVDAFPVYLTDQGR